MFSQWEFALKGEEDVVQSSRPNAGDDGERGVVKAVVGMGKLYKEPIKRAYLLGHLHISFLLDSWKTLLHAIFGSQETKEEVINGDQLLLLFC